MESRPSPTRNRIRATGVGHSARRYERLVDMLGALKLTAIRDQLDRLLGEAAR
jgi:hypothetical protein